MDNPAARPVRGRRIARFCAGASPLVAVCAGVALTLSCRGGCAGPAEIVDAAPDVLPLEDAALPDAPTADAGPPDAGRYDAAPDAAPDAGAHAARVCPPEMARVGSFCMDRYEAYVVTLDEHGDEHPHSPYETVDGLRLRAKSAPGVVPQAYISQVQAAAACKGARKRLCTAEEFVRACRGPSKEDLYPYGGEARRPGYCNEGKGSMLPRFYGNDPRRWTYEEFNDPKLNQTPGGLAKTGSYPRCVSPEGIYDCVGNLHEWGADAPDKWGRGRFRGGFYGDAEVNGHGCAYVTRAHEPTYHDYSTGFRCCADARTAE